MIKQSPAIRLFLVLNEWKTENSATISDTHIQIYIVTPYQLTVGMNLYSVTKK